MLVQLSNRFQRGGRAFSGLALLLFGLWPQPARAESATALAAVERELARQANVAAIVRVARSRNPELSEARARTRAARAAASARGRLPEPEVEYQLWAAPLSRPYALDQAQMHMLGVRQALPAPGRLSRESAALEQRAAALDASAQARERDLISRIHRAYADYYRVEREYQLHVEHRVLAEQALELARAVHRGGQGSQEDVLRALLETTRLHAELTQIEAQRRTARALLNALMARPSEAAIGPPAPIDPTRARLASHELELALARRPEVVAAEHSLRASESELAAARAAGLWPSFMVGVQYMYAPPEDEPHHYGVTLSMSLPWLNSGYSDQVRSAEATLAAEHSALSTARNTARYELYVALERMGAARRSLELVERTLMSQAALRLEAARAAYRGGNPDSRDLFEALSAVLDAKLERERLLAELETALAEVERVSGLTLAKKVTAGP